MMQNSPVVSVVLPVFNGGKYLKNAIDSVLLQNTSGWELLIVDDGSKDDTAAICDAYCKKDDRITAFHQQNGGVNAARAKGISYARGEYLTFLDADDALAPDALEQMLRHFEEGISVVCCGDKERVLDQSGFIKELWSGTIAPGVCGKLFKTSLFKNMDYALERRLVMGEDLLLCSIYSLSVNRAKVMPFNAYLVNQGNDASVTKTFKHNWEYEKYYFKRVEELFLKKCTALDSFEEIRFLINKSRLNAMKYVMLDGGKINYDDPEYKSTCAYFKEKGTGLGPSERLLFTLKNARLYRLILGTFMILNKRKNG